MTVYTLQGSTDSVTICDCCGKSNLKKTVVLDTLDDAGNRNYEPQFFGSTCAENALYNNRQSKLAGDVKSTIKLFSVYNFEAPNGVKCEVKLQRIEMLYIIDTETEFYISRDNELIDIFNSSNTPHPVKVALNRYFKLLVKDAYIKDFV